MSKRGQHPNSRANLKVGNPGNSGNPLGRTFSAPEIKEQTRQAAARRIPMLEQFADDPSLPPLVRMKAFEMLADYGGLKITAVGRVDEKGELAPQTVDRAALVALALAEIEK